MHRLHIVILLAQIFERLGIMPSRVVYLEERPGSMAPLLFPIPTAQLGNNQEGFPLVLLRLRFTFTALRLT